SNGFREVWFDSRGDRDLLCVLEYEHGFVICCFFFQAEDGIRDYKVTGVQTCALPIYRGDAYPCYGWAATAVEVEVDLDTYEVSLLDVTQVAEAGKAIHPALAEGQVEGGTVQALGYALLEEHFWSKGRLLNRRMQNYPIPTALDVPSLRTVLLENPYPLGPYGAKGLGELPMDGPAPAVAAAVLHATGKLVSELPLSPDRVMRALS